MNSSTYEKTRIIHVGENHNSEALEVATKKIVDSFSIIKGMNKIRTIVVYGSTKSLGVTFQRSKSLFDSDLQKFYNEGFKLRAIGSQKGMLMVDFDRAE